ncbi:hypothetical protein [Streptomyces sp. NBC_00872]|uniref:hypothetical protein n=1 Tax=Streptomyces sp. NBC_00872 TaxID=2903686 RepID=UPI0038638798|nr:hypothetical protein OG214_38145 [Streptomyces sp. NBC_00872]
MRNSIPSTESPSGPRCTRSPWSRLAAAVTNATAAAAWPWAVIASARCLAALAMMTGSSERSAAATARWPAVTASSLEPHLMAAASVSSSARLSWRYASSRSSPSCRAAARVASTSSWGISAASLAKCPAWKPVRAYQRLRCRAVTDTGSMEESSQRPVRTS